MEKQTERFRRKSAAITQMQHKGCISDVIYTFQKREKIPNRFSHLHEICIEFPTKIRKKEKRNDKMSTGRILQSVSEQTLTKNRLKNNRWFHAIRVRMSINEIFTQMKKSKGTNNILERLWSQEHCQSNQENEQNKTKLNDDKQEKRVRNPSHQHRHLPSLLSDSMRVQKDKPSHHANYYLKKRSCLTSGSYKQIPCKLKFVRVFQARTPIYNQQNKKSIKNK